MFGSIHAKCRPEDPYYAGPDAVSLQQLASVALAAWRSWTRLKKLNMQVTWWNPGLGFVCVSVLGIGNIWRGGNLQELNLQVTAERTAKCAAMIMSTFEFCSAGLCSGV